MNAMAGLTRKSVFCVSQWSQVLKQNIGSLAFPLYPPHKTPKTLPLLAEIFLWWVSRFFSALVVAIIYHQTIVQRQPFVAFCDLFDPSFPLKRKIKFTEQLKISMQ